MKGSCVPIKTNKFGAVEEELFRSLSPLEARGYDLRLMADSVIYRALLQYRIDVGELRRVSISRSNMPK